MRHLLTTLLLLCFISYSNAQSKDYDSYDDDKIVVSLVESNDDDVRCSLILNSQNLQNTIDSLIENGRYCKSIVNTRFGILVVHEPNTKNIQQMFTIIKSFEKKKIIKMKFSEGWAISYYNYQRGYALFKKDPEITRQSFEEIKTWKKGYLEKVEKLNAKGYYLVIVGFGDFFVQNRHGDNIKQFYTTLNDRDVNAEESIMQYIHDGWRVTGVYKSYNRYGNTNIFNVVFDKPKEVNPIKQKILILSTKGGFEEFKNSIDKGYRIDNIWCGWENIDYAALDASIQNYRNSSSSLASELLEVVGGITNSANQLFGGDSGSTSGTGSESDTYNPSSGSGNSKTSGKNSSTKSNHANWRSLEQSYSNYESQLIRMSNSSNIDKQEVRSIQRKMRDIREKIRVQSGGHQRATSQWENWNP